MPFRSIYYKYNKIKSGFSIHPTTKAVGFLETVFVSRGGAFPTHTSTAALWWTCAPALK